MTAQEFIAQNNGKQVDLDGFPSEQPYQCYDLVNKWSLTLGYSRFSGLRAYNIFGQQPQNYTSISNSPTAVPQAGDIIVWDSSKGNGYGHTAIANGVGNTQYFESLDQNWSVPRCVGVKHDYSGVIGWLRPKNINAGMPAGGTGGNQDMMNQGENEYARANKLHEQVRGRPLDRAIFNQLAGKTTWLRFIEILSDDPEANEWNTNAKVGQVARRDKWDQQIYTLQKQFADATKLVNDLQNRLVNSENTTKALTEKVDKLNAKVAELDNPDNLVVSRSRFNSIFDAIKSFFNREK